jgi:4-amino-4-deoxy-L-arabinose transferase-like glycosyltransferase
MIPVETGMTDKRKNTLIFLGFLAAALVLRLWDLGGKSLWLDEAWSVHFARMSLLEILTNTGEPNPPLNYVLLHFWIRFFGDSEVSVRALPVFFGTLSVGLMGWVGYLFGGRRLAWLTMAFMAFSPMPVQFSQMARAYSLYTAATLGSFGCLVQWERQRSRPWAAGYILSTVVMCYAHNYWVFSFAAQQIYMGWKIFQRNVPFKSWAGLSALALAGYFPWLAVLVKQTLVIQERGFWTAEPDFRTLYGALRDYVIWWQGPWLGLFVLYLGLALYGLFENPSPGSWKASDLPRSAGGPGRRSHPSLNGKMGLILLWLLFPLVLPFLLAKVATPVFHSRYTIAAAPPFFILVSRGIINLRRRWVKGILISVLAVMAMSGLRSYYQYPKEDWRGLARELKLVVRPGDMVAIDPDFIRHPFSYYYPGRYRDFLPTFDERGPVGTGAFLERRRFPRRVWVVLYGFGAVSSERVEEILRRRYREVRPIRKVNFGGAVSLHGYDLTGRGSG